MDELSDLFKIEYDGERDNLSDSIEDIEGVNQASVKTSRYVIDGEVTAEVWYDLEITDRTSIVMQIEDIDGVSEAFKS